MYDGTVSAAYLHRHSELVDDYLDYFSIRRWRFYQHLVKSYSEQVKKITDEHAAAWKAEYEKVLPKFTKSNGKTGLRFLAEACLTAANGGQGAARRAKPGVLQAWRQASSMWT
jgi:hypothetical protein